MGSELFPTNTSPVFHVELRWKRLFPRSFNVEYTWCVSKVPKKTSERLPPGTVVKKLFLPKTESFHVTITASNL